MPTKIYEIDLDIKNPEYRLVPYIEVVSGDTDANIFNIQLFENFVPLNASGNTAVIIFEKPDKKTVYQNLTIIDANTGKYTCILSSQTIVVPGRIKAEVALYEGTKKVTSTKFEFVVRKSLLDENAVESSNEYSALTEALGTVNQYDGRIADVEQDQAAHEAENVSHITFATRDISLTGDQVINVLSGKTPKTVKIYASITGVSVASWGIDNLCVTQKYDGLMTDNTCAVDMYTASGAVCRATVTKGVGNITLNWVKTGSPTGTARMVIETIYHGGA